MNESELAGKLRALFGGYEARFRGGVWTIESPGDFAAVAFLDAANLLGCSPDKLRTSFDVIAAGCGTCGPERELTLEVVKP